MKRLPPLSRWSSCCRLSLFSSRFPATSDMRLKVSALLFSLAILVSCGGTQADRGRSMRPAEFAAARWSDMVQKARGAEVGFGMWAGDENRNRLFRSSVANALKNEFGITLRIVPLGDTAEAVNKLLNEKGAGKTTGGSIDVLWIN